MNRDNICCIFVFLIICFKVMVLNLPVGLLGELQTAWNGVCELYTWSPTMRYLWCTKWQCGIFFRVLPRMFDTHLYLYF